MYGSTNTSVNIDTNIAGAVEKMPLVLLVTVAQTEQKYHFVSNITWHKISIYNNFVHIKIVKIAVVLSEA